MRRIIRPALVFALLAAPFLVVGNSPLILAIARATTQTPDVIPSPDKWTPFSAEGLIENASRGMYLLGRHYRASDGSERWEQGSPVVYVSIRNIGQATFYEWHQRQPGVWNAHPMELPNGQWRPVKYERRCRTDARNTGGRTAGTVQASRRVRTGGMASSCSKLFPRLGYQEPSAWHASGLQPL